MVSRFAFVTGVLLAALIGSAQTPVIAGSAITVNGLPSTVVSNQSLVVSGVASKSLANRNLEIFQKKQGKWKRISSTKVRANGKWSALIKVPKDSLVIRAVVGKSRSPILSARVVKSRKLPAVGPGKRIWGTDISRWQHIGADIDYERMASAGLSFIFIKASDGDASEDAHALNFATNDVAAAKLAGLYVGLYHRARLPVTNDQSKLIISATTQAQLAADRLASLGGYSGDKLLPYVLDIEGVDSKLTDASVTIWTKTWLEEMTKISNRKPIIYSYRSFLADRLQNDLATRNFLRSFHLWLAHPGDPADRQLIPGQFNTGNGCYLLAWTKPDCKAIWTFWQYTAKGDREQFGIPWQPKSGNCPASARYCRPGNGSGQKHLDLNVFSGTDADLAALARGVWKRTAFDYQ